MDTINKTYLTESRQKEFEKIVNSHITACIGELRDNNFSMCLEWNWDNVMEWDIAKKVDEYFQQTQNRNISADEVLKVYKMFSQL